MRSTLPKPKVTSHPVDIGHRTEAAILSELLKRGYQVLVPSGVRQRYDMVLDCDGRFLKVQCKMGRLRDGAIQFSARSVQPNTRGTRARGYSGEVNLFIVYCPENQGVYGIPANAVPNSAMYLRVEPPRNQQCKGVRWASEYELPA
jgi:hypothetical protein